MTEEILHGSGGHILAEITPEQKKKADLGVGKLFLAPIGKLEEKDMKKYYCNVCEKEFDFIPKIILEESNDEQVADNLVLVERGQYNCQKCDSIIGEYRVFKKQDELQDVGNAKSTDSF